MAIITLLFYAIVVFCLLRIVCQLAELLEIQRREEYNVREERASKRQVDEL